jgi:hypothetical protein
MYVLVIKRICYLYIFITGYGVLSEIGRSKQVLNKRKHFLQLFAAQSEEKSEVLPRHQKS